jgi:hypothetical protein
MSYVKSFFLWIQHVLSAVLDTVGCSRVVVDYELLMENPLGQIERMSSVLRLPMADKDSSIVHDYVNNFLDKNLQHTKYSAKDILFAPGATLDVLNTYEFLSKASRDEISLDNYELLSHFERFRNQLQAVAPIFLYINRLEDESIVFQQGINDRDAQLAERDAQLAERDAQLAERDAQLAERDGQLESLLASRSWRITAPLRLAAEAVCRITARR